MAFALLSAMLFSFKKIRGSLSIYLYNYQQFTCHKTWAGWWEILLIHILSWSTSGSVIVLASCVETLVVSACWLFWSDTFCTICRKLLCRWPFVATNMTIEFKSRFSIGHSGQWSGVHDWLLFRSASSLSEMCPAGCRSHHVWADFSSKSALPGCQILDRYLVVRLFLHISYLYNMHS